MKWRQILAGMRTRLPARSIERSMKRRWRYILAGIVVLALSALIYDRVGVVRWVGPTDLTIEFAVTEAESGDPIEGVEVFAHDPEMSQKPGLRLLTGPDGIARWQGEAKCVGEMSNLRLTNSRSVCPPSWEITFRHPDIQDPEPIHLYRFARNIVRTGSQRDSLVIPISLVKKAR